MPHSREVRATSHDDHDPILVAALAAGDLAGTDRDQALDLTRSCADCALLHDDLLALTRATASVPPPIATRPRDFQLTPADAARLRPGGWRRLVAAFSDVRSGLSRPLGVGLATIGLAGLLIGNVQISTGGSAAAPAAVGVGAGVGSAAAPASSAGDGRVLTDAAAQASAASQFSAQGPAPAASGAPPDRSGQGDGNAVASSGAVGGPGGAAFVPGPSDPKATVEQVAGDPAPLDVVATDQSFRPLNLVFGGAIVLGLALLLMSRRRGRPTN